MTLAAPIRFLPLYTLLYAGFGVQSPYLPALFDNRGIGPEGIASILAAGTAIRIISGPVAGRIADRSDAPRLVFAACSVAAALLALGYWQSHAFSILFAVGLLQAAAIGPLAPLSDSLAIATVNLDRITQRRFVLDYGFIRGAGSAAFIIGSVLAGLSIDSAGIVVIVWLNTVLLAAAALSTAWVPRLRLERRAASVRTPGEIGALLRDRIFRRVMLVVALILGSHALHDSFAVIRWHSAGIGTGTIGLLWSEAVAAEVIVFLFIGRPLLDRIGPAHAAALAAVAGVIRWVVMAQTTWVPALAAIEPLHGITFALLHLACMRLMAEILPPRLVATGLALYGTVGIGFATAALTFAAGPLYDNLGAGAFWVMAALCAIAFPVTFGLR